MKSYFINKIIAATLFASFAFNGIAYTQTTYIALDADWKYYSAGDEPSGNWQDIGYADGTWENGNAQLGYGDGDENTAITDDVYAAYFRYTFNVADPNIYADLDLNLLYDDGAVVYLNGNEIWRVNMPTGAIDYNTFASGSDGDNALASLNVGNTLIAGDNVIAVEVHQVSATSSDISFNFELLANESIGIAFGENWNYYDEGNEPAGTWEDTNYDDSAWLGGIAQLGYGDNDEATVISDATLTGYFRNSFNIDDPSLYANLSLSLLYDDGAVVYLNGAEIWRVNMPAGDIDYNTFAAGNSGDNAIANINITNDLITGINVVAVEVHQRTAGSSDLSFDFELVPNQIANTDIVRGPYLQKAHEDKMTIKWRTDTPAQSIVHYGTDINNLNFTESESTLKTDHEIELTNLNTATVYYYAIADENQTLLPAEVNMYFKTHPTVGATAPIKAWVLGDCGTGNNNARAVRDAYYNYIGTDHTDMILYLGDNAYGSGTDTEYQNAIFENMYEAKLKNSVSWSCLGNHDGISANSNTQTGPYYDIFSFPDNGQSGGLASGTEAYYSFDYGNLHVISLDSHESDRSVGGAMYNWCEADLQNTTQEWIVMLWHHPPYTKGSHNSDTETQLIQMRENFLPMIESYGVDLVLNGHSHSYERSYHINGHYGHSNSFDPDIHTVGDYGSGNGRVDGDGAYIKNNTCSNGTNYITAGSSGKTSPGTLDHEAMFYSVSELGSCVLEIQGSVMDVKFLRENEIIEDYFTIVKQDNCIPDLTPVISATPNSIQSNTVIDIIISIEEISNVNSDGPITIVMPKYERLNFGYNPNLNILNGTPLNNIDWSYDNSNPDYHIFTTNVSISANGNSYLGIQASYDPSFTNGDEPLTINILDGSGADENVLNNSYSTKIFFLH